MKQYTLLCIIALCTIFLNNSLLAVETSDSNRARFKQMDEEAKKAARMPEHSMEYEVYHLSYKRGSPSYRSRPHGKKAQIHELLYIAIVTHSLLNSMVEECKAKGTISTRPEYTSFSTRHQKMIDDILLRVRSYFSEHNICDCENKELYYRAEVVRQFRNYLQKEYDALNEVL